MVELILLISIIISLVIFIYYKKKSRYEGFKTNTNDINHNLESCPQGMKSFYNLNGDIVCCEGDILANKCISDKQCILSGTSKDIQSCVNMVLNDYETKGVDYCMPSMPNYFEDGKIKGCTNGKLNNTLSAPASKNQPTCYIYLDHDTNLNSVNSCLNNKVLDSVQLFGNEATKTLIQPVPEKPILVAISFIDNTGMHRTAYTKDSLVNFLNATNPNWKNQIDLTKNIMVAEVAKAYYIDRTISSNEIQI